MSMRLPDGVFRHPPIHLIGDELARDNLPELVARESVRLFGNDTNAITVKARHQVWEGERGRSRYVLIWSMSSHGAGVLHRFRIVGSFGNGYDLEAVEEEAKANLG